MKTKHLYLIISLLTLNLVCGQIMGNSALRFENNKITIEKVMAGIFGLAVYFILTIIARDRKNWKYIFLANLLIGWTIIGWFSVFFWSLSAKSKDTDNSKN